MTSLCCFLNPSSHLLTPSTTNSIPLFRPPIFRSIFRINSGISSNLRVNKLQMNNILSAEWINLLASDANFVPPRKIEPPRSGAVTFSTRDEKKIFTFGGYAEVESPSGTSPDRHVVNDLWTFHPHKESTSSKWGWTKVDQIDSTYIPGPRLATAVAVLPGSSQGLAVLLGGWDPQEQGTGGVILDDVSVLDLDTLQWSQPCLVEPVDEVIAIPDGPTSRHVAVPVCLKKSAGGQMDETILLHNHRCVDHVFLLSLSANEKTDGKKDEFRGQWTRQSTHGDAPSSRGLHCATQLNDSKSKLSKSVVLFGGAAKDGTMSNEVFVLDLISWKWSKLDCSGDQPSPRAGACLCEFDENTAILFGGAETGEQGLVGLNDVWSLSINTEKATGAWKCLIENQSVDGNKLDVPCPPGRNAATLTRMNAQSLLPKNLLNRDTSGDDNDAYFLLQGGWNPFRQTFNDVFVLRVSSK